MKLAIQNSKVKTLISDISSIAESSITNHDTYYCIEDGNLYIYHEELVNGTFQPNDASILKGWWLIENNEKEKHFHVVDDAYNFITNNEIDVSSAEHAKICKSLFNIYNSTAPKFINDFTIIGKVYTSGGKATINATFDGQADGFKIFNEIYYIQVIPWKETNSVLDIPLISGSRMHNQGTTSENGKSIDFNVVESNSIVTAGEGLEFVPDGIEISYAIIGELN